MYTLTAFSQGNTNIITERVEERIVCWMRVNVTELCPSLHHTYTSVNGGWDEDASNHYERRMHKSGTCHL
jgi:hypothetical protein